MKKLIGLLLCLQFALLSPAAMAQDGDFIKKTQTDLLIIAGAGVGGAILGLSTLSFVDKPSEHFGNVWTGAAIGIIIGVVYVAYDSATQSSEELQSSTGLSTSERLAWHFENLRVHSSSLEQDKVRFGTQLWHMNF